MRHNFRTIVLTGLLASAGIGSAFAQVPPTATPMPAPQAAPAPGGAPTLQRGPGRMDPAQREARMQQRFADMKAKLRITPQQEGAWTSFTTAMRPTEGAGPRSGQRPDRAEIAKMTTPQRIDFMREMRTRHQAEADRRGDAVKTFYASLTPPQQQTFDAMPMPHMGRHHGFGHGGGPKGHGPRAGGSSTPGGIGEATQPSQR